MRRADGNDGLRFTLGAVLAWASVLFASVIIAAHAVLILAGHWDGDEFFNFAHYRDSGISYLWFRTLTWSPRPVSELVLYFYALAVNALHAPLITPFLALLWAGLVGSALAVGWQRHGASSARVGLALGVVALFLLSDRISGLFLWPMAAAAYLPALAGLVVAVFQLLDGRVDARRGRVVVAVALSVAVLSSETGVFFTVGFAAVLCVLEAPGFWSRPRRVLQAWWFLTPLLLSIAVLACALRFRVGDATSGVAPTNAYFHHGLLSLGATLKMLPREIAVGQASLNAHNVLLSGAVDLLLVAGAFGVYRAVPMPMPPWRYVMALAAGLLSGMALLILASYYQYGGWGFGRHRTFFHCFLILLLLVVGRAAAAFWPLRSSTAALFGPGCLLAALVLGFVPRAPLLVGDYARISQVREARAETWDSGSAPGAAMRFVLPPPGCVIGQLPWQTGRFSTKDAKPAPWYVPGVLAFFHKQQVSIVPGGPPVSCP